MTGISYTAWIVIMCQLALQRDDRWRPLVEGDDNKFYRHCDTYCRRHAVWPFLSGLLPRSVRLGLIEQLLAKGAPQHYVLRKKAIAGWVDSSLHEGGQLVVIGGGFDALGINTARSKPQIACFEIDQPAMHKHKMRTLREFFGPLPENFNGVAANLSKESLYDILSKHPAFNVERPTVFVAEGITMYLDEVSVRHLFEATQHLCKQPPAVLFSAIEGQDKASAYSRLRDLFLSLNHERFSWSLPRQSIVEFLKVQGFFLRAQINYADLQQAWRTPEEVTMLREEKGEYLVYAVANSGG